MIRFTYVGEDYTAHSRVIEAVLLSEFRYMLDWMRRPIGRRTGERERVSQSVREGEHGGDPRCNQSGTAAEVVGVPRSTLFDWDRE